MTDTIRTKEQLLAFANPTVGPGPTAPPLTKQMWRDFVVSSQVLQTEVIDGPGIQVSEFADLVLIAPGGDPLTLPTATGYGQRTMTIANGSGGQATIFAAPGETINGLPSIILDDEQFALIGPDPVAPDWIVIVRTTKPKRQLYSVVASDKQNTMPGDLIRFGDTQNGFSSYVIPFDSQLVTVTMSRSDTDEAVIEFIKNGIVVGSFMSDELSDVISGLTLDFAIGDVLQVRNNGVGNSIDNPVVALFFEVV